MCQSNTFQKVIGWGEGPIELKVHTSIYVKERNVEQGTASSTQHWYAFGVWFD